MKKVKWLNVAKAIIFVYCVGLVLHDSWIVGFSYWFTGQEVGFTWYGLLTYITALFIIDAFIEDFKEQTQEKRRN